MVLRSNIKEKRLAALELPAAITAHERLTGVRRGSRHHRGTLHREMPPFREIPRVLQPRRARCRPNHAPDRVLQNRVHHPTRDPSPDDRTTDVRTTR